MCDRSAEKAAKSTVSTVSRGRKQPEASLRICIAEEAHPVQIFLPVPLERDTFSRGYIIHRHASFPRYFPIIFPIIFSIIFSIIFPISVSWLVPRARLKIAQRDIWSRVTVSDELEIRRERRKKMRMIGTVETWIRLSEGTGVTIARPAITFYKANFPRFA